MNNKLGIHALVWAGTWEQADRERAIANTAACGYDLIEIPLLDPTTINVADTVTLLERYNLNATTSLGLSPATDISSTDPDVVAKGEALLNQALSVARDLGATYLGGVLYSALHKYDTPPSEQGRQHCVAVLRRLADTAKKMGITIGLEPVNRYESNLINTAQQALDIIKQTGADNIVVHLDSFHANIEERSISSAIESCGNKLGYVHIGESNRGYLGSGAIDFKRLFKSLKENNYQGVITFESFSSAVISPQLSNTLAIWRNLWQDGEDLARHAKGFIEQYIKD